MYKYGIKDITVVFRKFWFKILQIFLKMGKELTSMHLKNKTLFCSVLYLYCVDTWDLNNIFRIVTLKHEDLEGGTKI
jgi:hypothetical protein